MKFSMSGLEMTAWHVWMYIMYSTLCINQCILGRNEAGQLGHGNVTRVDNPTEVSALDGLNIINVAIGKQHTLFVTGKKVFWASPYLQLVGRLQWASERYFSAIRLCLHIIV